MRSPLPQELGIEVEAVVAFTEPGYAIGRKNTIPWKLPGDMKRFKEITSGHAVLMGTQTALSIGRKLPNRLNLVMTRSSTAPYEGQVPVASMEEALQVAAAWEKEQNHDQPKLFVIGGEQIYRMAIPFYTGVHFTEVYAEVADADAFWPMEEFRPIFKHFNRSVALTPLVDNGIATVYYHFVPRERWS